jgi:hypothetical protein
MRAGVVTATLLASVAVLPGCASVAQVTNLGEPACRAHVQRAFGTILAEQGESQEAASQCAERAVEAMVRRNLGPRPFLVAAPSGIDYTFFVQKRSEQCVLRLYGRRKGFVSYTNNLTYIATRELGSCVCSE